MKKLYDSMYGAMNVVGVKCKKKESDRKRKKHVRKWKGTGKGRIYNEML